MRKKFNDTGLCVAGMHYMVDTSTKMDQIIQLIEERQYFTINRPRQFGKTSTQSALKHFYKNSEEYLFIKSSFEIATDKRFESEEEISKLLIGLLYDNLTLQNETALADICKDKINQQLNFRALSSFVSTLVQASPKKIILSIDLQPAGDPKHAHSVFSTSFIVQSLSSLSLIKISSMTLHILLTR